MRSSHGFQRISWRDSKVCIEILKGNNDKEESDSVGRRSKALRVFEGFADGRSRTLGRLGLSRLAERSDRLVEIELLLYASR